jgi:ABC-type Mn2+/Zn2+ transport system permease subunit
MNMYAAPALSHRQPSRLVQFGIALSAAAAFVAWFLSAVARLSEPATVITVMTLAFITSWMITNHRKAPTHRVTVVRARARAH